MNGDPQPKIPNRQNEDRNHNHKPPQLHPNRPAEKYNFVFLGFWGLKSTKSTKKYKKFPSAIMALF
jgi:hypothetical protein